MKEVIVGTEHREDTVVTKDLLAVAVSSGDVNVYATPMMIALMEKTAAACLKEFLDDGETSVGMKISTTHTAATPCGMRVYAVCKISEVDRKRVSFEIEAFDENGSIGVASHDRIVVNKSKFESKAAAFSSK